MGSYNAQTDDGPICNTLVDQSATDQFGLIVYSKLRSVEESASVSKNNITVAAYNDGYTGMGGFGYCHYLFVTDNSPLPWTACAFIAYMTCTADGFSAWGKDIGGYSSNPEVAAENEAIYHHETGGMAEDGTTVEYAALNDHGYDWWTNEGQAGPGGPPSTAPPSPSPWAAGSRCWTSTAPAEPHPRRHRTSGR